MVYVKTHIEVDRESPLKVDLLMGLCKRDAMSAALRRATELGVTSISPLVTDFSDVSPKQLPSLRAKWLATIESAAEQSGRTRLPELLEAQPFAEILSAIRDSNAQAFIAHPLGERLAATRSQDENYVLAIGPEGGFSDAEVDKACDAGFKTLALGPRILRAETAPAAALAILQHHAGDL
jgi:16S rRNA (uracil1498-N3)-methyltransferase